MKIERYTLRFVTPAFLGDAEQRGAWRTPPFKALIREWWRVLKAQEYRYDHQEIRKDEGKLFGHAWLQTSEHKKQTWAMKSQLLLRLSHWKAGSLSQWPKTDSTVYHPEVSFNRGDIDAMLYLGYGPLAAGTTLKRAPSLAPGEESQLEIAFPMPSESDLKDTLRLIHWFGCVGGRSRNGWGSVELEGADLWAHEDIRQHSILKKITRPLRECLSAEWPHAIGTDDGSLLVWISKTKKDSWASVMKDLAEAKIAHRISLRFTERPNQLERRHLLAYPVTRHSVSGWETERLANQLRFKVARDQAGFFGIIYHIPSSLPKVICKGLEKTQPVQLKKLLNDELSIWRAVHKSLDDNSSFIRI